ncbi:myb-related protein MYBAS2-like isoform X2 [Phragmites australis]|uniref:myb-related protein MYBAS2-like isoform X2 n=1 Tax=Phragmites australis TaxID=29695 RepID=UPI002D772CC7|nr:myb-related protein MYBAS2-like isoform X2 [Phragmites australis]
MVTVREEARKGPWTEQEDLQLVCTVRLFGERRWDFIAKVSGLNRTGKSCRLRWVNYLHPGLKRGRMSPHEERLILELHARWGNRWSRIARRLPGRTDNEIKNYWRTHMRKKAQERKRNMSPSSSSSSLTYQSCCPDTPSIIGTEGQELHCGSGCITSILKGTAPNMDGYPMDQIWMEIEAPEAPSGVDFDGGKDHTCSSLSGPLLPSAAWDYYCPPEACWKMDDEIKMAPQFAYSEGVGPCF